MWYPQKLLVKNLLSHKLSTYEFLQGKATMIRGVNDCDEEQESNGSGKSAILEGISLAIIGSPLRDASAKDLIRDGEDSTEVDLLLRNSKTGQTMSLWRCFYANTKSAELQITINDKILGDIDSVRSGDKFILDAIGITREDLLNYYLLSSEKYVPFLKMSDTKKKEMIGRFSQADLIDPTIDGVDTDILEKQAELQVITTDIAKVDAKIDVYVKEMNDFDLKAAQERRAANIKTLKEDLLTHQENLKKTELDIKDLQKELETCVAEKDKFSQIDYEEDLKAIRKKELVFEEELKELQADLKADQEKLAKYELQLLGAVECPKCSHEFIASKSDVDVEKLKKNKAKLITNIQYINEDIQDVESDIQKKVVSKRKDLSEKEEIQKKEIKRLKGIVSEAEDNLASKERILIRNKTSISDCEADIKTMEDEPIVDGTDAFKDKIKELELSKESHEEKLDEKNERISQLEELKATFVKFKTHLSNKAIGAIEAHANQYLERTGTDISLQLDGYKMTKAKKIKENISATIFRNGDEKGCLGKFSGGEKARIEIALIMSPQKLINMNCDSGGLDLLFLDEVIEAVDSSGIGGIMKSLNSTGQTILVITHGTFDQTYPYMVDIVKQPDGVSIIKQ